jgi:chromosome partitioning protein
MKTSFSEENNEVSTVICIAIRKGGVGKTTSAVNIATALQLKGYKTLLIDLEHTANATISIGINPYNLKKSIADLFTSIEVKPQDIIIQTSYGLSAIPANSDLEKVEAGMTASMVGILKPIIAPLRELFDFIIIDTPPGKSLLSTSALIASDSVLIPLEPHYLALLGLDEILEDIAKVRKGLNPELSIFGILPTKVQINPKVTRDILSEVERKYPDLLLPYRIKFAIKNVAASLQGDPLVIYDPTDETALEYIQLAEAIYEKTK